MDYELAIIGGGPAGYSAGIYAVRAGIKTILFEKGNGGGLASIAPNIENYPGFQSITGADLMDRMKKHATQYVEIRDYVEIVDIVRKDDVFILASSKGETYTVGAIVLAMGTEHKKLDVKGVSDFEGRGVSYCATCDGFFFKDKTVCVVGGGNSALIEAIYLKQIGCKKVYLIHRRDTLRGEEAYVVAAKDAGVDFELNTIITEVKGDKAVTSVVLNDIDSCNERSLDTDGVFISIGVLPQNELAKKLDVDLDEWGYVKVDCNMRTSVRGVYAAGDLIGGIRQVITAASEGAIAGLTSTEVLGKQYPY